MSTADKLNALVQTKADIKQALIDKGQNPSDVFSSYADDIRAIETGGGVFDFASIGYTGNEEPFKSAIEYAKEVENNWDNKFNFNNQFLGFNRDQNLYLIPKNLNFSRATNISSAFVGTNIIMCPSLTFNEYGVGGYNLFGDCSNLIIVEQCNWDKITDMNRLFYNCINLENVGVIDCINSTKTSYMFEGCVKLQYNPCINTNNVTSSEYMFEGCAKMNNLDEFDISKSTNTSGMFKGCSSMTKIPQLNTELVLSMDSMFGDCSNLIRIEGISVKSLSNMPYSSVLGFSELPKLRYFLCKDIGTKQSVTSVQFTYYNLSKWGIVDEDNPDARQSLIDSLITYSFDRASAGYSNCTIKLHQNNKALLTEDEIAQITAKGYTIA